MINGWNKLYPVSPASPLLCITQNVSPSVGSSQTSSSLLYQNVTRRSSNKPPLHPPSKSQDDTDEVKHGENGTYRLEEDLTEERHRLRVFVKLDKDSAEKEAAIGVRNHPRGPWKFSLHSGFTALPAFSAGLSMKDFILWLRTTANLKVICCIGKYL